MSVLAVLAVVLAVVLLLAYLQFRWQYRHIIAAASSLPCPPALPLIGNALFFTGSVSNITKHVIRFTRMFKGLYCIWVGPVPVFVVSNPTDAQIILNSSNTLEKDDIYKLLKPFLGNGLLTAPVPMWKKYRRLISPVLHPSNVEKFLPVFNDISRNLAEDMRAKGGVLDPREAIFNASMDAVIMTVFGRVPVDRVTKENIQYLFDKVGKMFVHRLFKVWFHIDSVFNFIYRKDVDDALKAMDMCLNTINTEWADEEKLRGAETESTQNIPPERATGKNLLDVCFAHPPDGVEDHDWKHEVTTMVVGATDTVVAAISFLLFTLAHHPEAQDKIFAEIQDVIGDSDRDVTLQDLNALSYLGQCVLEGMRIHGVFPVILRSATKDTKLSAGILPAGSRVLLTLHAMGWDDSQFPDPDQFHPERFSPENQKEGNERHNYAFLPFSGGPRNCPGKMYAMLIMKTVLVHILRRFQVKTDIRQEDIEYELKVVMFSKTPIVLRFEER